jgi:hypothetical protein
LSEKAKFSLLFRFTKTYSYKVILIHIYLMISALHILLIESPNVA